MILFTVAICCAVLVFITMEVSESCKREKKSGRKYRSKSHDMKRKVTLWHLGTKMWMFWRLSWKWTRNSFPMLILSIGRRGTWRRLHAWTTL